MVTRVRKHLKYAKNPDEIVKHKAKTSLETRKKVRHKTERRTRNEVATSMDKKMARLRAMRKKK